MEQKTNDEFMRNILIEEAWKEVSNYFSWSEALLEKWRKRSIPTHSEWLYPLTFDAGNGLKEA